MSWSLSETLPCQMKCQPPYRDLKVERFGEKLRTLRKHHGMSMAELAFTCGYSDTGNLYRIETGKKGVTIDFVLKVSRLFNISADVLIRDDLELDLPPH